MTSYQKREEVSTISILSLKSLWITWYQMSVNQVFFQSTVLNWFWTTWYQKQKTSRWIEIVNMPPNAQDLDEIKIN